MKFATGEYIVSPHNMVCVRTLRRKIFSTTFALKLYIHCCKTVQFYFGSSRPNW